MIFSLNQDYFRRYIPYFRIQGFKIINLRSFYIKLSIDKILNI